MTFFIEQTVGGLATGAIYASLALALVLIYRSTDIMNFAQGEMAMFATFIAWALVTGGMSFWLAAPITLVAAFFGGLLIERVIIRPVEGKPELVIVVVTIGLFVLINALAGFIWDYQIKSFPSPFPESNVRLGPVRIATYSLGVFATVGAVMLLLMLLFQRTKIGLAMRAAASNAGSSRLVGIRVGWMLALGWALAATVGTVSGLLVAPIVFLSPNMMLGVLTYAFASAVLGGFDSPVGAIVGGLIVGVAETLAGTYIGFIGSDLKILVPLGIIVTVLVARPQGLFGHAAVIRA